MNISTIEGIVENGQIRLLGSVALPEHAKVYVVVPDFTATPVVQMMSPRFVFPEQASDFAKQVFEPRADSQL